MKIKNLLEFDKDYNKSNSNSQHKNSTTESTSDLHSEIEYDSDYDNDDDDIDHQILDSGGENCGNYNESCCKNESNIVKQKSCNNNDCNCSLCCLSLAILFKPL